MELSLETRRQLIELAKHAAKQAYAPYSKFQVGAAVLTNGERIFCGCNVENASYGLTNCAERTAIFKMILEQDRSGIKAVVVYTPTDKATPPCGACRQVINEFGPNASVLSVCDSEHSLELTLEELLPHAFGPHNLS